MNKKLIEVVAAVIRQDNLYYLVQRPFKGEVGGKWEFPGGKIETNERHEIALARELKEELYIDIRVTNFILSSFYEYQSFNLKIHFYACLIESGTPQLTEHIDQVWVTKDKVLKLDLAPADIAVVELI
jgi:8-oxo-dGTP diphosphatase